MYIIRQYIFNFPF